MNACMYVYTHIHTHTHTHTYIYIEKTEKTEKIKREKCGFIKLIAAPRTLYRLCFPFKKESAGHALFSGWHDHSAKTIK